MNRKHSTLSLVIAVVAVAAYYFLIGPQTKPISPATDASTHASAAPVPAAPAKAAQAPQGSSPHAPTSTTTPAAAAPRTTSENGDAALHFGTRQVPEKSPGTIRLATYNIENLYDNRPDGRSKAEDEKPRDQKAAAAEALHRIDADIVALEEVESKEALIEFRDQYLKDMGYLYVASLDAGDGRGIEQSVLSRFPVSGERVWLHAKLEGVHLIDEPKEHIKAGTPLDLKRSPLHVTVTVPAEKAGGSPWPVTLFVMHHKAGKPFGYWRTAEAQFVMGLVKAEEKEHPDERIVVLGDFNGTDRDESVQTYVTGGLIDAFADRGKDPKFITHMSGRAVDFMMMSPNLHASVISSHRFVYAMPLKPQRGDWNSMPTPAGYASDHLPVVVDLALQKK